MNTTKYSAVFPRKMFGAAAIVSFSTLASGQIPLAAPQVREEDYSYAHLAPYIALTGQSLDKYRFDGILDSERDAIDRMIEIATDMLAGSEELPARYSRILDEEFLNLL